MSVQIPRKYVTELLIQTIVIQKRFAHEQVGVRNERRAEIKRLINKVAAEVEKASGN